MNIGLVIERMDLSRGGREMSTSQIASGLVDRGHEVSIICQQGSWEHPGVRLAALGRRGRLGATRVRNFVTDVHRHIGQTHYDVVHAMLPVQCADIYQLRGGTVAGQRLASSRRRSSIGQAIAGIFSPLNGRRRLMRGLERNVVGDENVVLLPVSEMIAEELADHYGRTENVRVIHNGVDVPAMTDPQRSEYRQNVRSRLGVGANGIIFITIATNFALKGIAQAIRAFHRWKEGPGRSIEARLVIVGHSREQVEGYERIANARGVGRLVIFEPPTDRMAPLYAAADVCMLLSWYDPCSRVVLEAARLGIPSITTAWNGAGEVLGDGAGVVVPSPDHVDAVAIAMAQLADPDQRHLASDACLRISDRLSMARHVEQLIEVYKEVLGE